MQKAGNFLRYKERRREREREREREGERKKERERKRQTKSISHKHDRKAGQKKHKMKLQNIERQPHVSNTISHNKLDSFTTLSLQN